MRTFQRLEMIKVLHLLVLLCCVFAGAAQAGSITLAGIIIQPQDSSTPAVNNPPLSNIQILDSYTLTLTYNGVITSPGTYNLTGF